MNSDPRQWIDGYFDDVLTTEQHIALSEWIKSDAEHARIFAQSALLHDQLHNSVALNSTPPETDPAKVDALVLSNRRSVWPFAWSTAASVAILITGVAALWFSFGPSNASAAYRELNRIIDSSVQSKDRTYEIVVEDLTTPTRKEKHSGPESRRPPKPPLDQATLHVREGNQFVLVRKTTDGLPFITGSNGQQSWAITPRGPVRVSSDINHFNRDLPGHETGVPLTNLHEGLERLKQAYHLQFSALGPEEFETQAGDPVRMLVAIKKPKERGPQRVEIAYDSQSGRILHMRFVQMPYGPDRLDLRLSLINEQELPRDFFEHTSHHAPDRTVETEN